MTDVGGLFDNLIFVFKNENKYFFVNDVFIYVLIIFY